MEVLEQFKAEVDGAELTPAKRLQLQQKYGLAPATEEVDLYLNKVFYEDLPASTLRVSGWISDGISAQEEK